MSYLGESDVRKKSLKASGVVEYLNLFVHTEACQDVVCYAQHNGLFSLTIPTS